MNYYPHNIGDFDKATRHLTRIERSIYRDLIDLYYDTEAQLPLDSGWICRRIIANSNEEATLVEQTLNEFFAKTPDGWYHDRCEYEIEHFRNSQSQKALAGKASAVARAQKRQRAINGNSTGVERALNERTTASQLNNNQEPITKNQEPHSVAKATVSPAKLPPCPHTEIIDLFAEHLPELPQSKPELWTGARAKALSARWKWLLTAKKRSGEPYATSHEEALAFIERYFGYVAESDFLTGRSGKFTSCDLGWLVNEANFSKVLQGNFENKEKAAA